MTTTHPHAPFSFISTAIPYVNAEPHLGYALEAVIADSIALSAHDGLVGTSPSGHRRQQSEKCPRGRRAGAAHA